MKRGVTIRGTLLVMLITLSATLGYLQVPRRTHHQTRIFSTKSDQKHFNEMQKILRNLFSTVAAFQVITTCSLPPSDASVSPKDAIFPSTLRSLPSTVNDIFIIKTVKPFNIPFLSEGVTNWKDFSIKLPEFPLGVSQIPIPPTPKKWFIEGFERASEISQPFSVNSVENIDGAHPSVEGIRSFLQNGLSMMLKDWVPATSILGLILITNGIQYADQLAKLLEKEVKEKQELAEKLGVASKESQDALTLRTDILTMASQLEELKGALQAARLKEKYSQTSADDANKELSSSTTIIEAMKAEMKSLRDINSATEDRLRDSNSATADRLVATLAQEKRLVEAIKFFMLEQGFMSPAVAQMLLSQSASEIIEKVTISGVPSRKEKELESEVSFLKAQLAEQQKSDLNGSKSVKADADKYMKMLTSEVDDLKQKLLASDERFMDLQREMQSKVDSAKAMAKELNARLETKDIPSETTTVKRVPEGKSSTFTARFNVLKEMSPSQRKRMSKPDLETELKKLGLKKSDDGRLFSNMLKNELLAYIDKMLA